MNNQLLQFYYHAGHAFAKLSFAGFDATARDRRF
jgi:hypothetical protein